MAVAAYRSLVSLTNLLVNVYDRLETQYPPLDAQPFDALREGVNFLLDFLEAHSQRKSEKLTSLWRRIAEVAHEADDIIDAHVVDLLFKESQNEEIFLGPSTFIQDMERVIQQIESIKTELLIAVEEGEDIQQAVITPKISLSAHASSATSSHGKDMVVGLDEEVTKIMGKLASNEADLRIITITGMGGIGKTTLAKTVYDHPFIVEYFDVRLWVSLSQEYVVEKVLQGLIDSGEKKFFSGLGASKEHKESGEGFSELREKLYKGLFGRRYLVVMDDVWSPKVWDDFVRLFPENGKRSRIMVTTRDLNVASSLSSTSNINSMDLLDSHSSWKLLCQNAFSQQGCPNSELEEVGKEIAEGCKGLPLSIAVIGSMLASSTKMTREYWEDVAKDVNSFRNLGDDGHCLEILSLSYNNLPVHLKSCFLDMKSFPEDCLIKVFPLLKKWIAEGLIHPIQHRTLESIAEEYFMTLVGRNLIFVRDYYVDGTARRCGVHDLVRDLCLREYDKEQVLSSPSNQDIVITGKEELCSLCGKPCEGTEEFPGLVLISSSSSQVSPRKCDTCAIHYQHIKRLSFVEVMDSVGEDFCQQLLHPTKVQYIYVESPSDLKFISPSFAHLLWRLQSLILRSASTTSIVLPSEIWKMPQLRFIAVERGVLTYPSVTDVEGKDVIVLKYLHILQRIRNFMCTSEVVCRVPNLKELRICDPDDSWANYSLCNLAKLHKLELLEVDKPIFSLENICFPNTLNDLYLRNTRIPWKDLSIVGSLPNLQWLVLENAVIGPDWNPTEGEFLRLKVLRIESTDLLNWRADEIHFPKLEYLTLADILQELEIPSGIGDIATLKEIYLERCGEYAINSAKQLWEEQQQDYGNEMLRVVVEDEDGREYEIGDEK